MHCIQTVCLAPKPCMARACRGRAATPPRRQFGTLLLQVQHDGFFSLQEEIGWDKAHLVGFSMGGMVASKLAALWPHRVSSLTLIASTRGGWDTLPRSIRAWKYVLKLARDKTPHTKATLDLKFHFTKKSLQKCDLASVHV